MAMKRLIQWVVRSLAAVFIFAVVGLAVLLALLWREHKTGITLPAPTGHFSVGRTTYAWVNDAEKDELAPSPRSGARGIGLDLVPVGGCDIRRTGGVSAGGVAFGPRATLWRTDESIPYARFVPGPSP